MSDLGEKTFPEANIHVPLREYIERTLAGMFKRQPCMSGDQRDRLLPHERRAVQDGATTILEIIEVIRKQP